MSTTMQRTAQEPTFMTVAPGVELCLLRKHAGKPGAEGSTILFRMAKGALARTHDHAGGEETYLISGKLRVGDRVLAAGDYL
jgi:quercetin dioxygenase-like cupin family protein